MLGDPRLAVGKALVEVTNADRAAGSNQREKLEANRVCERPIHVQREVPRFVDNMRRRQTRGTENWQSSRGGQHGSDIRAV